MRAQSYPLIGKRGSRTAPRSQLMITEAERRFPVRIKLAHPPNGFGARLTAMYAWLDENCGADGWAFAPAGLRGVMNDATGFLFSGYDARRRLCREVV